MISTADILIETALILRGEHPAYNGLSDRISNAEFYLRLFAGDAPKEARIVAEDILANQLVASEICGLSPDRCGWIAARLKT